MNLRDIADHACAKLARPDEESRRLARAFARLRYEMIWDRELWAASKMVFYQPVAAGQSLVTLPPDVSRVLAVAPPDRAGLEAREAEAAEPSPPGAAAAWFSHAGHDAGGRARITLHRPPVEDGSLRVTAKQKALADPDPDQTPVLPGAVSALLAYVEGDLLEEDRQYGKAQAKFSEGERLLTEMVQSEIRQQAKNARILPAPAGDWTRDDLF